MFQIRKASASDSTIIFDFITKIATYEKLESEVVTSVKELQKNIFEKEYAHVLIAEEKEIPIGFALYFFNFSTFVGKPGLYLEDLFVEPEYRGKGYGKKLFLELTKIAKSKNCGRMEWSVLNWNQSAIDFYESLTAKPMSGWTIYRLDRNGITDLTE